MADSNAQGKNVRLVDLPKSPLRLVNDDEPADWQKRPEETALQFSAFTYYRDLGPTRSIRKAYENWLAENPEKPAAIKRAKNGPIEKIGPNNGGFPSNTWGVWSRDNDWRERAEAYDSYLDAIKLNERTERQSELIEEYRVHTREMGLAQSAVSARFFRLVDRKLTMMEQQDAEALRLLNLQKAKETKAALEGKPLPFVRGEKKPAFVPLDEYRVLSQVMRNAAMVAKTGQEAEAMSVGVLGLQQMLEEQQSRGEDL